MSDSITLHIPVQIEHLSEQVVRARPLGPWKIQVVGESWETLHKPLTRRLMKALPKTLPSDLFAGGLPAESRHWRCAVELPPQDRDARWIAPLQIELDCFSWTLDNGQCVVRVPAVNCILLGKPNDLDDETVARQAHTALLRLAENLDLLALSGKFARRVYEFRCLPIEMPIGGLPEQDDKQRKERRKTATLREVASELTKAKSAEVHGLDEKVALLADHFHGEAPQSVLIVGPAGVGKTALVVRLAKQSKRFGLGQRRIWTTSGSRIVSGMSGLGMWQQRCSKLIRQAHASGAIVHFGSLFELLEAGKIDGQPGVASMVRQSISRGKLLAIAECTPEQLGFIERQDPMLLRAFTQVEFKEQSEAKIKEILRSAANHEQPSSRIVFAEQAIEELYRLHARFATYSALPAVALQLMRTIADNFPAGGVVGPENVARAFAKQTGLPQFLVDDSIPLDLSAIGDQLCEQVIGQSEPIELIVNLIATLKARLVRPGRPLASLMFIGPTGVGKTEMAKAIARLLYSDTSRMIRIDMSEYSSPWSAMKLIGKPGEGDGTLTSPIREQPFSVVLLDEFEKADAHVFDILLQMLGEGRLTDSQGRLADFRNAVVIMTSNLGAETFRDGGVGFGESEPGGWREHFQREVRRFVRPEFLGRIDRIVPFRPLPKEIVKQIAHRELEKLRQRPGLKYSETSLHFDDSAVELLCDLGYQPKYGARPLRRAIELHVAVPLANALSNLNQDHTWIFDVSAEAGEFSVQPRKKTTKSKTDKEIEMEIINAWQQLGRMARTAHNSGPVRDLDNELERTQRQIDVLEKKLRSVQGPSRQATLRSQIQQDQVFIEISRKIRSQLMEVIQRITSGQLALMTQWHRGGELDWPLWRTTHSTELTQLRQAVEDVVHRRLSASDTVSFVITGRNEQYLQTMWRTYQQLAVENGWQLDSYLLQEFDPARRNVSQSEEDDPDTRGQPPLRLFAPPAPELGTAEALADGYRLQGEFRIPPQISAPCGLALLFKGSGLESWLENEEGVMHFYDSEAAGAKRRQRFRVMFFPTSLSKVVLPIDWLEPTVAGIRDPRRIVDVASQYITNDQDLATSYAQGKLHEGLVAQIRNEYERALWQGIGFSGIPREAQLSNHDLEMEIPF